MLTNITIGQYFPGNSYLHRLDARTKIIALLLLVTAVFLADSPAAYTAVSCAAIVMVLMSEVPPVLYMRSLKPLWWIIVFTLVIHMTMTEGRVLWQVSFVKITYEGAAQAAAISLRLILLIVFSSMLTFTTSPITLTDALEKLLTPFRRFGLPAHELAMMMTIALRFIPTLLEETDRIIKAQESRGVNFKTGGMVKRVQNLIPLLVPLFISAFRRADELAMAMEARCYRGSENRTRMKVMRIGSQDYTAMLLVLAFLAAVIAMKLWQV